MPLISKRTRLLFLLLVYFVGILLILGSGSSRKSRHRTSPTRYYSRQLSLDLKTYPAGAQVLLEGKKYITPCKVIIPYKSASRGYHSDQTRFRSLRIEKQGYEPYLFSFSIKGREYKKIPDVIYLKRKYAESVSITGSAGALKRLTTGGPGENVLDISPDKKWLLMEVFETGKGASSNHILQKIDLHTGTKVVLSPKTSDSRYGCWAPDMNSIVFVSNRLGQWTIVQSLGTSGEIGVRFITQPALGSAVYPRVGPTGKDISFSIRRSEGRAQLCIIEKNGTNLRMFGQGIQASWHPGGETIVFIRQVGEYKQIFQMDASSGANLIELSSMASNNYSPVFSPDGRYIAFISDRVGGRKHLYIMSANGQGVTQLTDGYFDVSHMTWGEDGFIYFSANAGGNWDIWRLMPKL